MKIQSIDVFSTGKLRSCSQPKVDSQDWAAGYAVSAIAHVLIEEMPPGLISALGVVGPKQASGFFLDQS